jgi:hypothetical protein
MFQLDSTNWHKVDERKSISAEEHEVRAFQSTIDCTVQFYSSVMWGVPSYILSWMQMQSRNSLPSCLQHCRWIVVWTTCGSLFIVQHMWNPLCTDFSFPQAVGEDMIHTCCRNSNFCSNCRAWNITNKFNDRFHLWRSSIATVVVVLRGVICLFSAILNGICPSTNSFYLKERVSLTITSATPNTVRALLPNNLWNFFNVLTSVHKKLTCSISKSTAKQQLTSRRQCTFVTAAMVPLTLMIWVHSAATIPRTSKMTYVSTWTDFGKLTRHRLILLWSCPWQVEMVLMKGCKSPFHKLIPSWDIWIKVRRDYAKK